LRQEVAHTHGSARPRRDPIQAAASLAAHPDGAIRRHGHGKPAGLAGTRELGPPALTGPVGPHSLAQGRRPPPRAPAAEGARPRRGASGGEKRTPSSGAPGATSACTPPVRGPPPPPPAKKTGAPLPPPPPRARPPACTCPRVVTRMSGPSRCTAAMRNVITPPT